MGDRCYMEVTCRREDVARFEELGFSIQKWDNPQPEAPVVTMVDEEANYAHYGEMPTNVPYFGHNTAGGEYGDAVFACDGRRYAEVESGHSGGFVIAWNEVRNRPQPDSLRAIRRYLRIERRVHEMFDRISKQAKAPALT